MATPRLVIEFDASAVDKGAVKIRKAMAEAGVSAEVYEKKLSGAKREGDRFAQSIRQIEARLDPVTRATQGYERTVAKLQEGLRRNVLTQDRYNQLLDKARSHYSVNQRGAGGLAGAIQGVAGSYLSAAAALAAITGAFAAFGNALRRTVTEASEAQQIMVQVNAALASTHGISGQTAASLRAMAGDFQKVSTYGDDAVLRMQAVLLTFTNIRGDNFKAASQAVLDLSARLGTDLQSAAIQVGKAMNDPIGGITSLSRAGIQFSIDQKAMIRSMVEAGDMAGAQGIILGELERQFGGSAAAARDTFGGAMKAVQNAVGDLFEAVGEGMLPSLQRLVDTFAELAQRDETVRAFEAVGRAVGGMVEIVANAVVGFVNLRNTIAEFVSGMDPRLAALMFGGADTRQRRTVSPLERYAAPRPEGLTDAGMDAAVAASVKRVEAGVKAAEQYQKNLAEIAKLEKSIAEARSGAELAEWTAAMRELEGVTAEWRPDILDRGPELRAELSDQERRLKDWTETFEDAMKGAEVSARALIDAAFDTSEAWATVEANHAAEVLQGEIDAARAAWEEFNREVSENFVRGVQGALSQFATDVLSRSGNALDNFAESMKNLLIQTAAEYFSYWVMRLLGAHKLQMAMIAKENAARAAGNAVSGQGKNGGVDAGSLLGAGKSLSSSSTGGFALSGSAIAGIAVFAVMAAAVAYFRHRRSERDKERYGTNVDMSGYGGSLSAGFSGRLTETGAKVAEAMQALTMTIQESARAYIDGAMNATVKIRNDKKSFQALVDGELVGTFRTANEAVISAIKTMFLRKADLDPVIRQVLENNTATDPEALGNAVAYVQGVIDEIKGLTQVEATLQALPGKIRAMVGDLQMAGVEFSNAVTMAHQWGLAQFRGAWDSISGQQRSPEEERAFRERQKELLLDQMKLERIKLQQDLAVLKARAAIVKGGAGLARQEMLVGIGAVRGRSALLEAEADITRGQFGVWGGYLDGRLQFVEAEAGLYAAEIALLEKTLADLDALIKEVETTPIKIGGRGGGIGDVIGGAGRFGGGGRLITALERLISAVDKLREFQKSLAQDEQLSPYGVQQRFGMAQAQFQNVAAAAQQGKVWAIEMLPDVARQYLELASQMYGTAGAGYGGIFEQVNAILQAISDQYPAGTDPQAWMRSGMDSVNRYLAAIRGDGNRRSEQHDETNSRLRDSNRKMDDLIDAVERQGAALNRVVSTGATRPGIGGPRQGNGNFRAA